MRPAARSSRAWRGRSRRPRVSAAGIVDGNARLRKAVADAKAQQMPSDNIKRALQRGTGEIEGVSYDEVLYEGTGPSGTLWLVEGMTDNRNRTAAEIRKVFEKHNGTMGGSGTAGWAFDRMGVITLERASVSEDQLMEAAVGAGADDYRDEGEVWTVYTPLERCRSRDSRARGGQATRFNRAKLAFVA